MALNLTFVLCLAALLGSSYAQIEGNYIFESEENYEAFLRAVDVPEEKIPVIAFSKSKITVVKEGESYVASSITPLKTFSYKFTDGEIKEFDFFGTDQPIEFLTEIVGDEKLISKKVGDDSFIITRVFTPTQLIINMTVGDVVASKSYNRGL